MSKTSTNTAAVPEAKGALDRFENGSGKRTWRSSDGWLQW